MAYLMGIDLGTSSVKVLIVSENGEILAKSSSKYPILTPTQGWAEQDPRRWWIAVREAVKSALQRSHIKAREIKGIGLSGQMHGTVILGDSLEVLRPAIIWADSRSRDQCKEIYEKFGRDEILKITCNPIMPGFMAPSLLWVKENEPKIFRKIRKVLLPKDYIRFKLTGSLNTDFSDASATLLFDVRKREWSSEIISFLGLEESILPEIRESIDVAGEISENASKEIPIPEGIPVVTGGGDSPVGAIGCGLIEPGAASVNIGSAGQVFIVLESPRVDPKYRIHTFCHAVPNRWYLQGAILSAGLALDWLIRSLELSKLFEKREVEVYDQLFKEAESVAPGSEGLIFLPYLLGERSPHMDPQARGAFFGLTINHRRPHLVRAVLEGVAYALRDSLEVFKEMNVKIERMIARGGGARSKIWRRIIAEVLGYQILTVEVEEAAFGAALLAGVGSGIYKDLEEAIKMTMKIKEVISPNQDVTKTYEHYYQLYRSLYPILGDRFKALDKLSFPEFYSKKSIEGLYTMIL